MNTIDHYVTEVMSAPVPKYGKWFVDVKADSWGREGLHTVMAQTKEEADEIKVGHVFQA